MNDSVRTKLQASASGQNMRKRQSPKRKKSVAKEPAQKPAAVKIQETISPEYDSSEIEQHANVLFKPNAGPQTEFLAAAEREVLYGGSAGGGKSVLGGITGRPSGPNNPRTKLKMLNRGGSIDYRKGGMVKSTIDNRKVK